MIRVTVSSRESVGHGCTVDTYSKARQQCGLPSASWHLVTAAQCWGPTESTTESFTSLQPSAFSLSPNGKTLEPDAEWQISDSQRVTLTLSAPVIYRPRYERSHLEAVQSFRAETESPAALVRMYVLRVALSRNSKWELSHYRTGVLLYRRNLFPVSREVHTQWHATPPVHHPTSLLQNHTPSNHQPGRRGPLHVARDCWRSYRTASVLTDAD